MANIIITPIEFTKYVIRIEAKHCIAAGLKPGSIFKALIDTWNSRCN